MLRYRVEIDDDENYSDLGQVLRAYHDDKLLIEESDIGEPEDSCYYRDWKWVGPALEQAYALGLKDGGEHYAS